MTQKAPSVVTPLSAIKNRNHFYKVRDTGRNTGPYHTQQKHM